MGVFALLALLGPLLLLATTVVSLWSAGPLGWVASVLLVLAVAGSCCWAVRRTRRWWRSTKAPEQVQVRPADLRRRREGDTRVTGRVVARCEGTDTEHEPTPGVVRDGGAPP